MGSNIDKATFDPQEYVDFSERVLAQLNVLRTLLDNPDFGDGERSIGAELEISIIDEQSRPLMINQQLLEEEQDSSLTLELNQFNLEYNLSVYPFSGNPFDGLAKELTAKLESIKRRAAQHKGRVAAIGILPTLKESDLQKECITDLTRYHALSNALHKSTGEPFDISIDGEDPISLQCDDVGMEGANTSLQVHLRVTPREFADTYNALQLVSAPILGVSANSPSFLQHHLWDETRIVLFKQSVDSREMNYSKWQDPPRVSFGQGWVREGAFELFAETVHIYNPILPVASGEDSLALMEQGIMPPLRELKMHQGSTWPWNRAIYDNAAGGHLRIEMRALPAGPSVTDMVANAAFFIGVSEVLKHEMTDLLPALPFQYAEYNFYRAAQHGINAELVWPDKKQMSLRSKPLLEICQELVPKAKEGLSILGMSDSDINRLISPIEGRIEERQTGAIWQRKCVKRFQSKGGYSRDEAFTAMLNEYLTHQESNQPICEWSYPV